MRSLHALIDTIGTNSLIVHNSLNKLHFRLNRKIDRSTEIGIILSAQHAFTRRILSPLVKSEGETPGIPLNSEPCIRIFEVNTSGAEKPPLLFALDAKLIRLILATSLAVAVRIHSILQDRRISAYS